MKRTNAVFTLMSPAAPKPCAIRARVSVPRLVDSAQAKEAAVNTEMPHI
jgi:hypothetical protein